VSRIKKEIMDIKMCLQYLEWLRGKGPVPYTSKTGCASDLTVSYPPLSASSAALAVFC